MEKENESRSREEDKGMIERGNELKIRGREIERTPPHTHTHTRTHRQFRLLSLCSPPRLRMTSALGLDCR